MDKKFGGMKKIRTFAPLLKGRRREVKQNKRFCVNFENQVI
jgi:hypothetical protein